MNGSPILSVKDLSFRYDIRTDNYALSAVSFIVKRGDWLAVIGDNGSGKSTLARLIVGLVEPEQGSIFINNCILNEQSKWDLRKKVGIVFQNPDNQFIGTTVQDDVAFGLENLNLDYHEMEMRVFQALKLVDMYQYRDKDPSQLSGGQKQRVAIAGVLALQPDLMIFDEAFVMLDPKSRRELLNVLKNIQKKINLTILSITHDREEAAVADQLLVLKAGELIEQGTPQEVFQKNPDIEPPFAEQLRQELKRKGIEVPDGYMTEDELVAWICR
ncbi:energy-coupling factor transporter ATPase [Amphibacillus cookii]|uniref:energy-coupling factor transporter ATPase n=1 Tax=Amphibacillus cookii TaxID=767787 RepID=UPI00195EEFE9|nr:energy-coupling factor transporter ATPase [Amphibacillus cookii]MBM7543192.1 energy-coupling factor transport system ATP-binding protein [Amphibacillus cookii]